MTRTSLPAGVPADNRSNAGAGAAGFAPEMAIPRFASPGARRSPAGDALDAPQADYATPSEYEDDVEEDARRRAPSRMPAPARSLMFLGLIAALLGILGAIVLGMNDKQLPLCSDLPEWNQYNCRVE